MIDHECDCEECKGMCERFPCRPLPEEVAGMPADVRARLSIQSEGDGLGGIPHLQAAVVGFEGGEAHEFDVFFGIIGRPGRCTFLTGAGLCELHGKCKPFEGRVSIHGMEGRETLDTLNEAWDTDEGREVLDAWRAER